ncbi:MAG: N-acetylmuramoyl-L-alanine amidase [Lachnospiraceae bacterium]|nr:N-acetylmuramoyl-L-alanine amidase [Lachnospiraceae bacterium]
MRARGRVIFKKRIAPMLFCIGAVFLSLAFGRKAMAYENLVIVIDPGHGGDSVADETDTGAHYNGVYEKAVDMVTAQALVDELSQYGNLTVYMTRTEDVHMDLQDRVDFAKSVNADYIISIHYNASAKHRFYGTEIFTSAYGEDYAKGYSLAETINSWWVEDGNVSKGIKTRIGKNGDYYGMIRKGREAGIPTIILEHGYLDNDHDFSRLNNEEAWRHMGQLDATAIADYFGVKKGMVQAGIEGKLTVPVPTAQVDDDLTPPENVQISIDSYDKITGVLTYTVSASEPDSMLMYYDLDTQPLALDEEKGFQHLKVWESGKDSMQGTFQVPEGYTGPFVARVYNNYEKFTDSVPVSIPAEYLPKEEQNGAGGISSNQNVNGNGQGSSTPQVTLQDENGATWTLDGALKEAKGAGFIVDHNGQGKNKNYIGMVIALVVAGTMLVAAICMAVATTKRKGRKRRQKDRMERQDRW